MELEKIYQAVVGMDQASVVPLVQAELDSGTPVQEILQNGLIAAMDEVGAKFSKGEMFRPRDADGRPGHEERLGAFENRCLPPASLLRAARW